MKVPRCAAAPASRVVLAVLAGLVATGCGRVDAGKELAVTDVETYWVIDQVVGQEQYIAPTVRFRLHNKGTKARRSVEAAGAFRLEGTSTTWGSGWARATEPGETLAPGESVLLVMVADARYHSPAAPEQMFEHERFMDAEVEVFVKVAGSRWAKVLDVPIERRVGTRDVEEFGSAPDE